MAFKQKKKREKEEKKKKEKKEKYPFRTITHKNANILKWLYIKEISNASADVVNDVTALGVGDPLVL